MFRLATNQRYRCRQCGKCCRSYHVAITPLEIEAIARLPWPQGHPPVRDYYTVFRGQPYLRRKDQIGGCVFLDEQSRCRMHAAFGSECKALSCRAYPFEFLALWDDQISVAARYDCPAVLENQGEPLSHYQEAFTSILNDKQLSLGKGFSEREMDGLTREAVLALSEFAVKSLEDTPVPALRLMFQRLERLGRPFANDTETLREVLPSMLKKATAETPSAVLGQSWPERIRLRQSLLWYLRRDEELPDFSLKTRLRLARCAAALFMGFGNAADFGSEHPDLPLKKARLFDEKRWAKAPAAEDTFHTYRRFLRTRLETLQFFGRAGNGAPFFKGLDMLLETHEAATLLARLHAAGDNRTSLAAADGDYAAACIDHCLGRRR